MRSAQCHPDRKHYAKGLCSICYRKKYLSGYITPVMAECHPDRPVHARGLCGACYQALRASDSFEPKQKQRSKIKCGHPDGKHVGHGLCSACYSRAIRAKKGESDKRARRDYRLKKEYGITAEEADALFLAQGRKCALCDNAIAEITKAHIDHCHETGRVRGMLCFTCNKALGMLGDNEAGLLRALRYVKGDL